MFSFDRLIGFLDGLVSGMALSPWAVLAGGRIRTDAEEQKRRETGEKGS